MNVILPRYAGAIAESVVGDHVEVNVVAPPAINAATTKADGLGCHGGAAELKTAANAAGKSEILDRYAADYPKGPHDQPQSMCPAFGSLRVGLRAFIRSSAANMFCRSSSLSRSACFA